MLISLKEPTASWALGSLIKEKQGPSSFLSLFEIDQFFEELQIFSSPSTEHEAKKEWSELNAKPSTELV